jgi:hypothetical protein
VRKLISNGIIAIFIYIHNDKQMGTVLE